MTTIPNHNLSRQVDRREGKPSLVRDASYYKSESRNWLILGTLGIILGFAAPGFDQWYLAWFGLVPLLVAALTSRTVPEAFYRGVPFGFGYSLIYLTTILEFTIDVWPDSFANYLWLANPVIWILVSLQQSALIGTFCSIIRWLPLTPGLLPRKEKNSLLLPALLLIPVTWCLINNKLGNSQVSLSIPWSLLEYTQYEQRDFIQIANIVGGIGISALIVMFNVALFYLLTSFNFFKELIGRSLCSRRLAATNLAIVASLLLLINSYGASRIEKEKERLASTPHETVTLLQGNILFGMAGDNSRKFLDTYLKLAKDSPPSICIWPEWSYPAVYQKAKKHFEGMAAYARENNQSWVIGCLDSDSDNKTYNAICGIDRSGKIFTPIYHKRYLVPFAERTPPWILNSPLGFLCGTLTPRREGYSPGSETVPLEIHGRKVSQLLCCELASPELTAEGVRKGGQLIVDCSNTSWFDSKTIGKQCIAACIIRAIENHRSLAFATTLGPSVIVDATGEILARTPRNKCSKSSKEVPFYSDQTVFNRWFR